MSRHLLVWRGLDAYRCEFADVTLDSGALRARGTQIGVSPTSYRLDYELETYGDWITARLQARVTAVERVGALDLRHDGDGSWTATSDGEHELDTDSVAGALDCDLGLCPLTNTMPVLRSELVKPGPARDFVMAWVSVPDLGLQRSEQRYEHVERRADGGAIVRYVGAHRSFVGELDFDRFGFVARYPELAERVG